MFKANEDLSIYVTRGDIVAFSVTATQGNAPYMFKGGDVLRMKVFEKKNCNNVVLQKDFGVEAETEVVDIHLTELETRIGDTISKPVDYWYEVELNPYATPQTIIGYDDDGPKVFKLFPEGRDLEDIVIEEEDLPYVDKELDLTSHHPVENQAIAKQFAVVGDLIANNADDISGNADAIAKTATALASHTTNKNNPHNVTAEQIGARPDTWMPTAEEVGARPETWMPTAEDVGARSNAWMPTAEDVGAAPAIESTDRPGCYYRMVNGVQEWLNPPLDTGAEYRTTERYMGDNPVYITVVNVGYMASGTNSIEHNLAVNIPLSLEVTNNDRELLTDSNLFTNVSADRTHIHLVSTTNFGLIRCIFKYIK